MKRQSSTVAACGLLGLALLAVGSYLGLFVAPAERYMGEVQRIMYVHVPSAWIAMVCYTGAFVFAVIGLWNARPRWDGPPRTPSPSSTTPRSLRHPSWSGQ